MKELDEYLSDKTNLNQLNIFIFDDEIGKKYEINSADDFVFLNNLFLNENNINYKKLANFVKKEYLRVKKLSNNFDAKLNFIRKPVRKL